MTGPNDTEFQSSEWLLMPSERRETALRRLRALQRYEEYEKPGVKEADEAAEAMGVSRNQFYNIRNRWVAEQSLFSLAPFHGHTKPRPSRLQPEVKRKAQSLARSAIQKKGFRAPKDILREIREGWDLVDPLPSHMTLRRIAADTLEQVNKASGPLQSPTNFVTDDVMRSAITFGDALIIEDVLLDLFVATEAGAVAPRAMFAIDLATSSIISATISFGRPSIVEFRQLLRDVEHATEHYPNLSDRQTRLLFKHEGTAPWNRLLADMLNTQSPANAIQVSGPSEATATARLIGTRLGDIKFAPRLSADRMQFDPSRHSVMSLKELKALLTSEIKKLKTRRLPEMAALRRLRFPFLDQSDT